MELSQFRGLAKKLPIILGVLLIFLVGAFAVNFVSRLTNTAYGKLPVQKFRNQMTNTPKWLGNALQVPQVNKAEVFKITSRKLKPEEANTLAKRLGFAGKAKILPSENGTLFNWLVGSKELYVGLDSGEVSYKDNSLIINFANNKNRQGLSKDQLVEKARNIISDYSIEDESIALNEPKVVYLRIVPGSMETHDAETTEGAGDLISMNFQRKIGNFRVVTPTKDDEIEVMLTRYGDLNFLSYSNLKLESREATYPLLSRKDVVKKVNDGKAVLTRFQDPEKATLNVAESVLVNNGELAFYNDQETEYLQPIFVFDSFVVRGFSSAKAWVYLPAISDKQFVGN